MLITGQPNKAQRNTNKENNFNLNFFTGSGASTTHLITQQAAPESLKKQCSHNSILI